jgi:hypothetical protein
LPKGTIALYFGVFHYDLLHGFIISGEFTDLPIAAVNYRFISGIIFGKLIWFL